MVASKISNYFKIEVDKTQVRGRYRVLSDQQTGSNPLSIEDKFYLLSLKESNYSWEEIGCRIRRTAISTELIYYCTIHSIEKTDYTSDWRTNLYLTNWFLSADEISYKKHIDLSDDQTRVLRSTTFTTC